MWAQLLRIFWFHEILKHWIWERQACTLVPSFCHNSCSGVLPVMVSVDAFITYLTDAVSNTTFSRVCGAHCMWRSIFLYTSSSTFLFTLPFTSLHFPPRTVFTKRYSSAVLHVPLSPFSAIPIHLVTLMATSPPIGAGTARYLTVAL